MIDLIIHIGYLKAKSKKLTLYKRKKYLDFVKIVLFKHKFRNMSFFLNFVLDL